MDGKMSHIIFNLQVTKIVTFIQPREEENKDSLHISRTMLYVSTQLNAQLQIACFCVCVYTDMVQLTWIPTQLIAKSSTYRACLQEHSVLWLNCFSENTLKCCKFLHTTLHLIMLTWRCFHFRNQYIASLPFNWYHTQPKFQVHWSTSRFYLNQHIT